MVRTAALLLFPLVAFAQQPQQKKLTNRTAPTAKAAATDPLTPLAPVPPSCLPDTSNAGKAATIAADWQQNDAYPAPGENGTVVMTFGASMAPVVCEPERLCTIYLQAGEKITSQPLLGDTTRWEYQLLTDGEGSSARTSIVLKPFRAGLTTDIAIPTNRRSYRIRLMSVTLGRDYTPQVEFRYPGDAQKQWAAYQEKTAQLDEQAAVKEKSTVAKLEGPMNFNYTVKVPRKSKPAFAPKTVYDDTTHTYFKMPAEAAHWATAVLQTAGPNGCEIVNYRVNGDTWIVDRLFSSAELISGTGKQALRVEIDRDGAPKTSCGGKIKKPESVSVAGGQ